MTQITAFRAGTPRSAIIELPGNGELSAGELIEKTGMEQANVSQHLAVLRAKQLVVNRKAGNQVSIPSAIPFSIRFLPSCAAISMRG
ncbi:ArsR family transcriptional regulator [Paracidobacterium acidisoli]|uniref:ArsR family transcriptional regulator n=1 Tax=Paracidobacterium acidisoli TaxID=2303751 RepID=UPI00331481C0